MENPFQIITDKLNSIESLLQEFARKEWNQKGVTEETDTIFNVSQTAKFLGLTIPTVYSKVSRGELPVMKQGNRLYFSMSELMEHLKTGKKKSSAEINAEAQAYLSNNKLEK